MTGSSSGAPEGDQHAQMGDGDAENASSSYVPSNNRQSELSHAENRHMYKLKSKSTQRKQSCSLPLVVCIILSLSSIVSVIYLWRQIQEKQNYSNDTPTIPDLTAAQISQNDQLCLPCDQFVEANIGVDNQPVESFHKVSQENTELCCINKKNATELLVFMNAVSRVNYGLKPLLYFT